MKPSLTIRQHLIATFWIMTISVIILTIVSQLLINNSLEDMKADLEFVDIVKEQSVLSLEIVKNLTTDKLNDEPPTRQLDSLAGSFYATQRVMLAESASLDNSYAVQSFKLNKAYKTFQQILNQSLYGKSGIDFFPRLLEMQAYYLNQLNEFVAAINGYSNEKIKNFQLKQEAIILGSLIIFILEAVVIVLPVIKKVQIQNMRLRAIAFHQSHIVRSPLTNIMGLVSLAESEKDEDIQHKLYEMLKNETTRLDDIIQKTVNETK